MVHIIRTLSYEIHALCCRIHAKYFWYKLKYDLTVASIFEYDLIFFACGSVVLVVWTKSDLRRLIGSHKTTMTFILNLKSFPNEFALPHSFWTLFKLEMFYSNKFKHFYEICILLTFRWLLWLYLAQQIRLNILEYLHMIFRVHVLVQVHLNIHLVPLQTFFLYIRSDLQQNLCFWIGGSVS